MSPAGSTEARGSRSPDVESGELAATVFDPQGPAWIRWLPTALGWLLVAMGWAVMGSPEVGIIVVLLGLAVVSFARFVPAGRGWRPAKVEVAPGSLRVKGGTRFDARGVRGATSHRTANGYALVLEHRKRPRPIAIEVATFAELDRVCRALGVGRRGYGALVFEAHPSLAQRIESALRACFAVSAVVLAVALGTHDEALMPWFSLLTFFLAPFTVLAVVVARVVRGPEVTLLPNGIAATTTPAVNAGYASVLRVEPKDDLLVFTLRSDDSNVRTVTLPRRRGLGGAGMSSDESAVVQAIVLESSKRARGEWAEDAVSPATLEQLVRQHDEPAARWLARIDALARSRGVAYRGASLPDEELLKILEDQDLPSDARAAAVRLLAKGGVEIKTRIAPLLAAEHDPEAQRRIEAALAEDDEAILEAMGAEARRAR